MAWVKKKAGPPADELADLNDLKDAQSGSEVFLVGYFAQFEVRHNLEKRAQYLEGPWSCLIWSHWNSDAHAAGPRV